MNADGNFPTYEQQQKVLQEIAQIPQSYDLDKFIPFSYVGVTAGSATFKELLNIQGAGLLDIALLAHTVTAGNHTFAIEIIVDGVVVFKTALASNRAVGIHNQGATVNYATNSAGVIVASSTPVQYYSDTAGRHLSSTERPGGVYTVFRPLKFKQSLVIKFKVGAEFSSYNFQYRLEGGVYV